MMYEPQWVYELTFWGAVPNHTTHFINLESAKDEAYRIHRLLELDGVRAAHAAIIYGPGYRDGLTIN